MADRNFRKFIFGINNPGHACYAIAAFQLLVNSEAVQKIATDEDKFLLKIDLFRYRNKDLHIKDLQKTICDSIQDERYMEQKDQDAQEFLFNLIYYWDIYYLFYYVDKKKLECSNCFHIFSDRDEEADLCKRFVFIFLRNS